MRLCIFYLLALVPTYTYSASANNVHLIGHVTYMVNFFNELGSELERRGWSNLKVPDMTITVNETVLDRHVSGTVTYFNGFMASMQVIDVMQAGVDQVWSWNSTDSTGTVLLRSTMRMLDVALGYDVIADLEDGRHRYTVTVTYPENRFPFEIRANVNTGDVAISINNPQVWTPSSISRIRFLPLDVTSDVLTTLFNLALPGQHILNWGEEVFVPICYDIYHNKVEFPTTCYNCPMVPS